MLVLRAYPSSLSNKLNKIVIYAHLGGSSGGLELGSSLAFPAGLSAASCSVRISNSISTLP